MTEDLLPCPFCGQESPRLNTEIITEPLDLIVYVECHFCSSRGEAVSIEMFNFSSADPQVIADELTTAAANAAESWNQRDGK